MKLSIAGRCFSKSHILNWNIWALNMWGLAILIVLLMSGCGGSGGSSSQNDADRQEQAASDTTTDSQPDDTQTENTDSAEDDDVEDNVPPQDDSDSQQPDENEEDANENNEDSSDVDNTSDDSSNNDSTPDLEVEQETVAVIAHAGTDQFIKENQPVVLDASGSIGNALTYEWIQIQTDDSEQIAITNPNTATIQFTPSQIGKVAFELTATDSDGQSQTDRVYVFVDSETNKPPFVTAGLHQWVYPGVAVTLDGRHTVGIDDGISIYQWEQIKGVPVSLTDTSTTTLTFTAPDQTGLLEFEFRAKDKAGNWRVDNTYVFVMGTDVVKPVIHAGGIQSAKPNDVVTLTAIHTETSESTLSYVWRQTEGPSVQLINQYSNAATFTAPNYSGALKFEVLALGAHGRGDVDTVSVHISADNNNQAPVANAGLDQAVKINSVVSLDGKASYDDDKSAAVQWLWETQTHAYRSKIGNYEDENHNYQPEAHPFKPLYHFWRQTAGPKVEIVSANHFRAAFSAPSEPTTLEFELTVADELGATSSDKIIVKVEADDQDYGAPLLLSALCSQAAAQCGSVTDVNGNSGFCGTCSGNSICGTNNQCLPFGGDQYEARYCDLNFAQCGGISDGQGGSIQCGTCATGQSCIDNQCEPTGSSSQVSAGPDDSLFLHLPNHLTEEDISTNRFAVNMVGRRYNDEEQISRNILTEREYVIDLADKTLDLTNATISVRFMPSRAELNTPDESQLPDPGYLATSIPKADFLQSDAFTFTNTLAGVQAKFTNSQNATIAIENTQAQVQARSCNHFAVSFNGSSAQSVFNGYLQNHSVDSSSLIDLANQIKLGQYSGKAWDLRIYNRTLTEAELKLLSGDCDEKMAGRTPSPLVQERLNEGNENNIFTELGYVCGVYYCTFWWLGEDDASKNYQGHGVKRHNSYIKDELHEFFLLDAGMYKHGSFFEFYNGNGYHPNQGEQINNHDAQVRESHYYSGNIYCKSGYDIEAVADCGQHANHEDFHRFQGNMKNLTEGGAGYKPLTESVAQWAADWLEKGTDDRRLPSFTQVPHLPIWTKQDKGWSPDRITKRDEGDMDANLFAPEDMVINGIGARQYAIYPIWSYYVENITNSKFIGALWNTNDYSGDFTKSLTEVFNRIGLNWSDMYLEAAAHIATNDHAYENRYNILEEKYWNYYTNDIVGFDDSYWKNDESLHEAKYSAMYSTDGTQNNWVPGRPQTLPGNWGHNIIKVDVNKNTDYDIQFRHNKTNLDFSEFRTLVVLYDPITGTREYKPMAVAKQGQVSKIELNAKAGTTLLLVVAQTPSQMHDRWAFDFHQYDYKITTKP